ncbi:MAG TPA: hypothetical protein VFM65_11890 [Flavobacteriaceae bacterium]|nr:hypothetical protein [Flavobacteriaceae bacterium]
MEKSYLHTKFAIMGGSFASTVPSLGAEDFLVSAILAVFGAVISFVVSVFLKYYFRKLKRSRFWTGRKSRKAKK